METRIFKDSNDGFLVAYSEDQIRKQYNVFGFYKEDEDFEETLKIYKETRNEKFEDWKEDNPDFKLSDVKNFLQDFIEGYEYYPEGYFNIYGRPRRLYVYEDQEEYYKDIINILGDFFHEDGTPVEEHDLNDFIEVYRCWDGRNHQEIILTNEYEYCYYEEVTDQYPQWDDMEVIDYNRGKTGHSNLYLYEDEDGKKYILEDVSYWQGSITTYEELSESQLQEYLFLHPDVRTKIEEAEQLLQDHFASDLKRGESILLEDNEVVFKFKGELYHFTEEELQSEISEFYYNSAVKRARKAIGERRKEQYAEILSIKFDKLPLNRIYVTLKDSVQAGNCEAHSIELRNTIARSVNANGEFAARADQILKFRNDDFAKRAIIRAYINHYRVSPGSGQKPGTV